MDLGSLLSVLIVGAIAGWLAGNLYKGKGFGVMGNIAVGSVGRDRDGLHPGNVGIGAQR